MIDEPQVTTSKASDLVEEVCADPEFFDSGSLDDWDIELSDDSGLVESANGAEPNKAGEFYDDTGTEEDSLQSKYALQSIRDNSLRYGPIFALMMVVIFFLLPIFLSSPNSDADWSSLAEAVHEPRADSSPFRAEQHVSEDLLESNLSSHQARDDVSDLKLSDSESTLLDRLQKESAYAHKSNPQTEPPSSAQLTKLFSRVEQQVKLTEKAIAAQHDLAEQVALLGRRVVELSAAHKHSQDQVTSPAIPSNRFTNVEYVLDTTSAVIGSKPSAKVAIELKTTEKTSEATKFLHVGSSLEQRERLFSGIVLHSFSDGYLNFVSIDCKRFSHRLGDSIAGFGTIIAIKGSRVYSHSQQYISRGHYRQCSRSVLSDRVETRAVSDSSIVMGDK